MNRIDATTTATVGDRELRVEVRVAAGEVVALAGPNGAGKSTTIDVLLGLRAIRTGTIHLAGRLVADGPNRSAVPPSERGLAWVPQRPALLPRRRVIDQVMPFARADRAPLLRDQDLGDLLVSLGLGDLHRQRGSDLSGGQAQRVAVARALANSDIVLFDEATSAQDHEGARAVRTAIRAHVAAGGCAIVVAHQPRDAWAVADRAIVLENLRPVQTGAPQDLAARPATAYVAQVAGTTVLHGHVDPDHVLHTEDGALTVGDQCPVGPVTALVRPTAITLHTSEPTGQSARNVLRATVETVEHHASGVRVVLDSSPRLTASLTGKAAEALHLQPGSEVWASCKATDIDVHAL